MYNKIREALVVQRRRLGISQTALARRMSTSTSTVGQSYVSQLETGEIKSPSLDTLVQWCKALQIEITVTLAQMSPETLLIVKSND